MANRWELDFTDENILEIHGYKFKKKLNLYERADGYQARIEGGLVWVHDGNPDPVAAAEVSFRDPDQLHKYLKKLHNWKPKKRRK